jgi:M3 family oligoendopeptidase
MFYNITIKKQSKLMGAFSLIFGELVVEKVDVGEYEQQLQALVDRFVVATSFEEQDAVLQDANQLKAAFISLGSLTYFRYMVDTTDPQNQEKMNAIRELEPILEERLSRLNASLLLSEHRSQLEGKWGRQLFRLAEIAQKKVSSEVVQDLQEESKWSNQYLQVIGSAKIHFDGEERTIPQMGPYLSSTDRAVRLRAYKATENWYASKEAEFDQIMGELIRVRTTIAKKLGYVSFVDVGYARMQRMDYGREQVERFRAQVKTSLVPLVAALKERQRKRLGVDVLRFHDETVQFQTGNAKLGGDAEWVIARTQQMFAEMSPETNAFFTAMLKHEMMDLLSKKGKMSGAFAGCLPVQEMPYIFANFRGTKKDVEDFIHEAGHAFQMYQSRHFKVVDYYFPSSDACEIHSKGMELLSHPWMELFFAEDAEKFTYAHLSQFVEEICYVCAVDEFQHVLYEHPELTPTERKRKWREIEREYQPWQNYEGYESLEQGSYWHRQQHIFNFPFYYIDYALAGICALQLWAKANHDRAGVWQDYLNLCASGGSKSFLGLVAVANVISPFEDGCVEEVIGGLEQWFAGIDDAAL